METKIETKRVGCFYRVSTAKQLDKNDIPMQRQACREFVDRQQGWTIVREYTEKGVSGYKVSANDRDELQRAKKDAENGVFDILLVYMFDRLGRKDDETPFVVQYFDNIGVEVWSTLEGQQKFENHVDKLMNYIRFWQANGESQKTSQRVNTKHKQMVEGGQYRGGTSPYGYKLVKSGEINKKGKELMKLAIDEEEAIIVRTIFNLVYKEGYGGNRIVNYLNKDRKIPSKTGGTWTVGVINYMLRNPIYKGKMTYGRRTNKTGSQHNQSKDKWILSDTIEELIIIPEEIWDKVQIIRNSRTPKATKRDDILRVNTPSSGKLLFVGYIYCGHCGSRMTTTINNKVWITKDGTVKKKYRMKYRCTGKSTGRKKCDGQTIYSSDMIEELVLDEVYIWLDRVKESDYDYEISQYNEKNTKKNTKQLNELIKKNEENYKELATLKNEIAKSLMGKSAFSPTMLNDIIKQKEDEIEKDNDKIRELELELKANKMDVNDMCQLKTTIPVWKEMYQKASIGEKKMMLAQLIDRVTVYRDRVEVNIKMHLNEFTNRANMGQLNKLNRENKCVDLTAIKWLEELLVVPLKKVC